MSTSTLYLTIDIVAMFFENGAIGRFSGTDCLHFKTSRLCISCSKFEFIQGDLDARTRKRFNQDSMTDFLPRLMNSLYNRVAQNNAHFSRGLLWLLLDDFVLGDLNGLGDHIHLSKPRLLFLQSLSSIVAVVSTCVHIG